MIRGLHGLLYSSDPEASRAFVRDKLQLPYTDVGDGWLIFDLPEADFGFHPTDEAGAPTQELGEGDESSGVPTLDESGWTPEGGDRGEGGEGGEGGAPEGMGHGVKAGTHDVSFYCDDINGTVAELEERGVEFRGPVADHGYGYVTYFTIPGGIEVQLYEPKYQKRARPERAARAARAATKKPAARAAAKKPTARAAAKKPARAGARKAAKATRAQPKRAQPKRAEPKKAKPARGKPKRR